MSKLRWAWWLLSPILIATAAYGADECRAQPIKTLPGSGSFASDFLETISEQPAGVLWGLTADLSSLVPSSERAMYISRSADGGLTWTVFARIGPNYFNADIGEGERNGLAISPGGKDAVLTTQKGAFQVMLQQNSAAEPMLRPITGPPHAQA